MLSAWSTRPFLPPLLFQIRDVDVRKTGNHFAVVHAKTIFDDEIITRCGRHHREKSLAPFAHCLLGKHLHGVHKKKKACFPSKAQWLVDFIGFDSGFFCFGFFLRCLHGHNERCGNCGCHCEWKSRQKISAWKFVAHGDEISEQRCNGITEKCLILVRALQHEYFYWFFRSIAFHKVCSCFHITVHKMLSGSTISWTQIMDELFKNKNPCIFMEYLNQIHL